MSEEPLLPSEVESRRRFERELDELDGMWSDYASRARRLLDEWEKVKVKLLEKISRVDSLLRSVNEDLEKISVEIMLGLASEEEKREERAKLEDMKSRLESRLRALQEFLDVIESRIAAHSERLGSSP